MSSNFIDNVPVTDAGRIAASEVIREEVRKEFSVGRVIAMTFKLVFANIHHFILYGVLSAIIPVSLILALLKVESVTAFLGSANSVGNWSISFGWILIIFLFFMTFVIAVTVKIGSVYHWEPTDFATIWSKVFKSVVPVSVITILAAVAMVFGFFLLLVPGYMIMCAFYVVHVAEVEEKTGIMRAFDRSRALTSGYRWHIFGVYFIIFILSEILTRLLDILGNYTNAWVYVTIAFGEAFIAISLYTVAATLIFHMLRDMKEGNRTSHIEAVFE